MKLIARDYDLEAIILRVIIHEQDCIELGVKEGDRVRIDGTNFDKYMEQYNLNLQIVWTNLIPLFERWMYAGIPMVVLGALTWSFPKGSRQRFLMSVIYLAGSIVWLLYVLNFGDLTNLISVTYDDNTFELGMVLTFLLYLLVLFRALKILIVFGVYKDERNRYLEGE